MQQVVTNLIYSKARPMVLLRYLLGGLITFLGFERLRIIIILLGVSDTYKIRDTLTYYLMAKAILLGENPYQSINELGYRYYGISQSMHHPAVSAPFTGILSLPLLLFSVDRAYIAWFCFEMICLVLIAIMLPILVTGKVKWQLTIIFWILLISWYPVMVELLLGQLTILLTTLLLAALLAWKKDKRILSGILTGATIALKMYTWPLILYYAIKKEWRIFISSCITIVTINVVALMVIGFGPITDYYLKVTLQASAVYHSYMRNYSIWSIGYRLFEGTHGTSGDFLSAAPLINQPQIAPLISAGLALIFLVAGLVWAMRSNNRDIAYSIMLCVSIGVSPITWDHYYLMLIIALVILAYHLFNNSFYYKLTVPFLILVVMLYTLNEYIGPAIFALNGGVAMAQANGNRISFSSSLLETLPIVELVLLTILLWRTGVSHPRTDEVQPIV